MFSAWIALVSGLFLVVASLILTAKNVESKIVFKVIPFVLGVCLLFSAAQLFGFVVRM